MGMTILSGAGTTMSAGIILQGCQMTFFVKMSVLIIVTVASSLVWSLCFYMSILLSAGPTGNTCAIGHAFKRLVRICPGSACVSAGQTTEEKAPAAGYATNHSDQNDIEKTGHAKPPG